MTEQQGTRITWLGHSMVLIQTPQGTTILIDPFIEQNPKYPKEFKLPVKIDFILLTHGHFDHIADAAPVAKKHDATIVAIYELANYMAGKGVKNTIGINMGGTIQLNEATATMVEAKHSSGAQDDDGVHYVGAAAGFVIHIPDQPTLYHSGDTTVFADMNTIGDLYQPEIAMLPIGGHFTMGPKEAAVAARFLRVKTVLPIHFGTFPPLKGTPEDLATQVGANVRVVPWKPGESF